MAEETKTQKKTEKVITKEDKKTESSNEKKVAKTPEKKEVKKKKNTEAVVNGRNIPISNKQGKAIGKFIKNKTIEQAISDLTEVLKGKRAVPMVGEIGHKKGVSVASGSGKYPKKASEEFITLLKSLKANAQVKGVEKPIISLTMTNVARRPFGKFGRVQRKRAHVTIKVTEKINKKSNKK